ncbi:unnamed protein product [Polarella glacialis]|uniref:catechol O-methyltransferase n=1 Tax=Polarella glacialis TaxID=89957 RepID=A0A813GPZ6_POLGL|nr:unnamed protein product [Polarella glacialis]
MQELTPQCLANIAWAFAKNGMSDPELFDAISRRASATVRDFVDFDVTNLCWALARVDAVDFELFDELATHTVRSGFVKRFSAQMASYMAWSFAATRVAHEPLFEALADFIAKHANVFETQHVANCAWAYAAADVPNPLALGALAAASTGGRLWHFRQDELCALCWAFAKVRWSDEELLRDMVQVASQRLSEFDGQSLVNLLSSLVALRADGSKEQIDAGAEPMDDLKELLDKVLGELLAGNTLLSADELAMAARCFCRAGRLEDACALCEKSRSEPNINSRAIAALLSEAELRSDQGRAAGLWQRLALEAVCEEAPALRAACLHCAASCLAESGRRVEAQEVLQRSASEVPVVNAATQLLARRLGLSVSPHDFSPPPKPTRPPPVLSPEERRMQVELTGLLEAVLRSEPGSPSSVLRAMESFGAQRELLEVMAGGRAAVLDEAFAAKCPRLVLELGGGCSAAAARLAARGVVNGSCIVSIESDPFYVAVARCVVEMCGFTGSVRSLLGQPEELLSSVWRSHGQHSVDLLLLRGGAEARYLSELGRVEALGLLAPGCVVLADHVLRPGAPRFLWRMSALPGYRIDVIEVMEPGLGRGEDWMALCTALSPDSDARALEERPSSREAPAELASLTAESERLWRRRQASEVAAGPHGRDHLVERFTGRLRSLATRMGLSPSRRLEAASPLPSGLVISEQLLTAVEAPPPEEELGRVAVLQDDALDDQQLTSPRGPGGTSPVAQNYLRALDFKNWLQAVDPSGGALCYLATVQESYDTVAQITKTYIIEAESGRQLLSPELFADLGVDDKEHQDRFFRWFRESCDVEAVAGTASHQINCEQNAAVFEPSERSVTIPSAATAAVVEDFLLQNPRAVGVMNFGDWLASYDTVAQITKTYIIEAESGRKLLSPELFADLGVDDKEHQDRFFRWFRESSDVEAVAGAASHQMNCEQNAAVFEPSERSVTIPSAATAAVVEDAAPPDLRVMDFGDWLASVDPSGGVRQYLPAIEESYDTVAQIAKTYTVGTDRKSLDPQLFADLGIEAPEHMRLFTHWFSRFCGVQVPPSWSGLEELTGGNMSTRWTKPDTPHFGQGSAQGQVAGQTAVSAEAGVNDELFDLCQRDASRGDADAVRPSVSARSGDAMFDFEDLDSSETGGRPLRRKADIAEAQMFDLTANDTPTRQLTPAAQEKDELGVIEVQVGKNGMQDTAEKNQADHDRQNQGRMLPTGGGVAGGGGLFDFDDLDDAEVP